MLYITAPMGLHMDDLMQLANDLDNVYKEAACFTLTDYLTRSIEWWDRDTQYSVKNYNEYLETMDILIYFPGKWYGTMTPGCKKEITKALDNGVIVMGAYKNMQKEINLYNITLDLNADYFGHINGPTPIKYIDRLYLELNDRIGLDVHFDGELPSDEKISRDYKSDLHRTMYLNYCNNKPLYDVMGDREITGQPIPQYTLTYDPPIVIPDNRILLRRKYR